MAQSLIWLIKLILIYRLSNLKVLEVRENRLKTLPKSMCRLTELIRLDVGTNEFEIFVS